ncbi:MAG: hypothetical protein JSV89_18620 [Spirochaetaceae bacterium]|nr:MAG: hypothetical protein JSV89_18620 [Spirochaetaceae bacterium]
MKLRIIGDAPVAAVLAGVLAAEKHEVIWNPDIGVDGRLRVLKRRKEIRLNLPWGWVRTASFGLSSSSIVRVGELGVVAAHASSLTSLKPGGAGKGIGGKNTRLLVLNIEPELRDRCIAPESDVVQGLSLLEAVEWDPGFVEVSSPQPWLILEAASELGEFVGCLRPRGIGVLSVDELSPYRNALHIWNLLALPIALCHSTLSNFLSYVEGREIAVAVLEEGLQLFSLKALRLGKLPVMDPQDLLQRLRKKPQEFDKARNLPDRAYGAALQHLLADGGRAVREANDRIVRMAAQTGLDPTWNWTLTQKLSRALRVGFYRDPVELYNTLR